MAIYYPLTLPDHEFTSFNMRLARKIGTTTSPFTYQAQHFENVGTQWEAEVTLPPLTDQEAKAWQVFFLSCRGTLGTFRMRPPLATTISPISIRLNGAHVAGATAVSIQQINTAVGDLPAGSWLSIMETNQASKLHLYMTLGELDFNGQYSVATCDIQPPLRTNTNSNMPIQANYPYGIWRLASPDIGFSINEASLYGFTFACVEASGP